VHHGGAGTTAVSLRAGIPTLILWTWPDQSLRGGAVKRLKVGTARRFSSTNLKTLIDDLRTILRPQYRTRAREVAPQITKPAESISAATDLVENCARLRRAADQ
jgi:UDP:flavonoid glycosyltransferase YjiC (YdhE family)